MNVGPTEPPREEPRPRTTDRRGTGPPTGGDRRSRPRTASLGGRHRTHRGLDRSPAPRDGRRTPADRAVGRPPTRTSGDPGRGPVPRRGTHVQPRHRSRQPPRSAHGRDPGQWWRRRPLHPRHRPRGSARLRARWHERHAAGRTHGLGLRRRRNARHDGLPAGVLPPTRPPGDTPAGLRPRHGHRGPQDLRGRLDRHRGRPVGRRGHRRRRLRLTRPRPHPRPVPERPLRAVHITHH
jgi:hypothetical protein